MPEIRKGLSWGSLTAILLGLLSLGLITWSQYKATTKTDEVNYTKGAQHTETTSTVNISPTQNLYPLSFPGCSPFIRMDNLKLPESERNNPIINGIRKR